MSQEEKQKDEQSEWVSSLEWIAFGFVLGVMYCTLRDVLALKNEVRWVRRINRFKQAWQETKEDIRQHLETEHKDEQADD